MNACLSYKESIRKIEYFISVDWDQIVNVGADRIQIFVAKWFTNVCKYTWCTVSKIEVNTGHVYC